MAPLDTESTQTARSRLLAAGKTLFARLGYEQTSTAAIAREALTSESQLVRHFEGKAGLLAAIFEESWRPVNEAVQSVVADASNAHEAVLAVFSTLLEAFARDPELAFLLLFEGRRPRGGSEVATTKGAADFTDLVQRLVKRGQRDGTFPASLSAPAVAVALFGVVEGLVRERVASQRAGKAPPFDESEQAAAFRAVLAGLAAKHDD